MTVSLLQPGQSTQPPDQAFTVEEDAETAGEEQECDVDGPVQLVLRLRDQISVTSPASAHAVQKQLGSLGCSFALLVIRNR